MFKKLIGIVGASIMLLGVLVLTACDDESLADYKATKSQALQEYADSKGESNYTVENWATLQQAVTDGKQAVGDATNKSAVDTAVNNTKVAINAIKKEVEMADIVSIHFFTTENWVHWQDHKYYDFVNKNYSTKRILVEFDGGKPVTVTDDEYAVKATFTEQQLRVFFDSIMENGIFDLDEHYHENADDGDSWSLIITLSDGTTFESNGYVKYPTQKDALDEAFLALTGYKLFTPLWVDNQ